VVSALERLLGLKPPEFAGKNGKKTLFGWFSMSKNQQ